MGIDWTEPLYLLLLLPATGLLVHWWRTQQRVVGWKRYIIVGIRALFFLLLILALAGTHLLFPVRSEIVVFVVDRSASMKEDARVVPFLQEALKGKAPQDQYGIVSVGRQAVVEQPISGQAELTPLGALVQPHATNLAEGIRLAAGMIPSQARGKIVLISDGLQTHGDALVEAKLAQERGIIVDALPLQQPEGDEAVLASLQVPDRLFLGEEFPIKVTVEGTAATRGTLILYEGNEKISEQAVQIEKGQNRFVFQGKSDREGFHRYRVELKADKDTIRVNNQAYAFTQVNGTPKVLVLEGHPGAAGNLVRALEAGEIAVDVLNPSLLPKELDDYKQYAGIVLADLQATQVSDRDMERMRAAVRDLGLGLVMTGGPDSFGMGGWFKTPIEEALPVYMDLRGKEELPSLGLVLVIDKSGSMSSGMGGPNKMELAKEAAIRATEMLNDQDELAVVGFDSFPFLVVEPQSVKNLDDIQSHIGSIYADGGTDIFPSLQMAYENIKLMKTQRKHVILLTDGRSGRQDDYGGLLGQMKEEKITVSTVAVGNDADTLLLEEIARMGSGRYYMANDPGSIPKIFSKETALASRTFIVEKPQIPQRFGGGDWSYLRGDLPPIHAYMATTAKVTTEKVLVSADKDPYLARWQYGLGRAVAWTSDLEGKWSPLWATWGNNGRLWNQIISWTFPQVGQGGWETDTELDGMKGRISVTLPPGLSIPQQMEAIVLNQELNREIIPLKPVAPGKLQGEFAAGEPGTYMIQVVEKQGERIVANETAGLSISYSPEYGLRQNGESFLRQLAAAGGGQLISEPSGAFGGGLPGKWEEQQIGDLLLMLAAILWPLDIAARRVQLSSALVQRWRERWFTRRSAPAVSEARSRVLGELQAKKGVGPDLKKEMSGEVAPGRKYAFSGKAEPRQNAVPGEVAPRRNNAAPESAVPVKEKQVSPPPQAQPKPKTDGPKAGSPKAEPSHSAANVQAFNRLLKAKKKKR
ncbi:VWA domain-containing protein [Ferviditalea candida]|uniref:VWA domain-containing protein n=1 Tax=Ferviditalea candida TaxID=3108399 RepID=A0ABU5ZMU6_9BACL|nr:VWA domain-containing protein [Paenibacillaceae bacterium T2]